MAESRGIMFIGGPKSVHRMLRDSERERHSKGYKPFMMLHQVPRPREVVRCDGVLATYNGP